MLNVKTPNFIFQYVVVLQQYNPSEIRKKYEGFASREEKEAKFKVLCKVILFSVTVCNEITAKYLAFITV